MKYLITIVFALILFLGLILSLIFSKYKKKKTSHHIHTHCTCRFNLPEDTTSPHTCCENHPKEQQEK